MFSWNDVDVLFTFNFDDDLKLTFSKCPKDFYKGFQVCAIDGCHFLLNIHVHVFNRPISILNLDIDRIV